MQQNLINVLFDQDIYLRSGMGELGRECDAKIAAKDIVALSFDDESIKDFGRPNITPRNKIADLIRFAYEGGASVIVLDMALSEPDNSASVLLSGDSVPMTGKERDQELFKLLDKIKNDDTSVTKILLATDIHNDMTVKEGEFAALIDNKKIYAAVPKVSESLINDRRVRFWLPYMETIKGDEKKILW